MIEAHSVVRRTEAAGLHAGAPLSQVDAAFALAAPGVRAAEVRLRELVRSEVDVVGTIGAYLADSGGKRLRPMLTVLGGLAVGRSVGDLACVGELIHLGSLLHDDVVDDGTIRRGRAAAHRVYGNAAVVLTGDFCLARAVLLAAEAGGHAAVTALAEAVTAMAEGEVLQLQRAGNLDTTLDEYVETVEKKSAALIAWCASAGALAAGNTDAAAILHRFGIGVGIAFQITDDVLDYRPSTGKPPGQDLREHKVTLPLLHAMERISDLRERLDEPDALALIAESGALEAALDDARARVEDSLSALDGIPAGPARDALAALAHHLVERTS